MGRKTRRQNHQEQQQNKLQNNNDDGRSNTQDKSAMESIDSSTSDAITQNKKPSKMSSANSKVDVDDYDSNNSNGSSSSDGEEESSSHVPPSTQENSTNSGSSEVYDHSRRNVDIRRRSQRRRHTEPAVPQNRTAAAQTTIDFASSSLESDWENLPLDLIVDRSFLKKHKSKKDLVMRMMFLNKSVKQHIKEAEQASKKFDPTQTWPGAGSLLSYLAEDILMNKDSHVRSWAAYACMELLALIATKNPLRVPVLKNLAAEVFLLMASLAAIARTEKNKMKLGDLVLFFSKGQIGAVLAEIEIVHERGQKSNNVEHLLSNQKSFGEDSSSDDKGRLTKRTKLVATSLTALELLAQMTRTLLHSARADETALGDIVTAIIVTIRRYEDFKLPPPAAVLDELLLALVPGPTVKVPKYSKTERDIPPVLIELENPVYKASMKILQDKAPYLMNPISSLLHHLLAKTYHGFVNENDSALESNIATEAPSVDKKDDNTSTTAHDTSIYSIVPLVYHLSVSRQATASGTTIHSLLESRVLGMLQEGLKHIENNTRRATCLTVAKCLIGSAHLDPLLLTPWLSRHKDAVPETRKLIADNVAKLLYQEQKSQSPGREETSCQLVNAIEALLIDEPHVAVRGAMIHSVFNDYLYKKATDNASDRAIFNRLLRMLLDLDLSGDEEKTILNRLVEVWARGAWAPLRLVLSSSKEDGGKESTLFASLLMQRLKPDDALASPSARRMDNETEERSFLDWLIPAVFQHAIASQHHQHVGSNNYTRGVKSKSFSNPMECLDLALDDMWRVYVKNGDETVQQAAAIVLWHRLPFQLGVQWGQRKANRQKALLRYLEARWKINEVAKGTEDALVADTEAAEALMRLSLFISSQYSHGDEGKLYTAFHDCRDRRIFRILSTIATPTHSSEARKLALEQVPNRFKAFASEANVADLGLEIVQQTAMPGFMNFAVLKGLIQIAELYPQLRTIASEVVHMITHALPKMAEPAWKPFTKILQEIGENALHNDEDSQRQIDLVTAILATAAPFVPADEAPSSYLLELCHVGTPEQAQNSIKALVVLNRQVQDDDREDCLHSPLSLIDALSAKLSFAKSRHTLTILASLTALVESSPDNTKLMESASQRPWRYGMNAIHKVVERLSKSPKRKRSPSPACKKADSDSIVCSSVRFLVCFVRASLLGSAPQEQKIFITNRRGDLQQIFNRMVAIMRAEDVSDEVRSCAAIHFCRLCDSRLQLEGMFVTPGGWHTFAQVFLEKSAVQEALDQEFRLFLVGAGVYGDQASPLPPKAPSLRIASLFMFSQSKGVKIASRVCAEKLRVALNDAYVQLKALGKEDQFEKHYKMLLMPEYMVPYAFNLLVVNTNEKDEQTLRKRLKALFDPLIQSLGESADNLSFLLRVSETLGEHKAVIPESFCDHNTDTVLPFISRIAQSVLLSMVKTDVNLSPYSGQIHVPRKLFVRVSSPPKQLSQASLETDSPRAIMETVRSSMKKRQSTSVPTSEKSSRVQFSPLPPRICQFSGVEMDPPTAQKAAFGDVSPIAKSATPKSSSLKRLASESLRLNTWKRLSSLDRKVSSKAATEPDGSADFESPDSRRPMESVTTSDAGLSLAPSDLDSPSRDSAGQTTSKECLLPQVSSLPTKEKKGRKNRLARSEGIKKSTQSTSGKVPKQIEPGRSLPRNVRYKHEGDSELDFDPLDDEDDKNKTTSCHASKRQKLEKSKNVPTLAFSGDGGRVLRCRKK